MKKDSINNSPLRPEKRRSNSSSSSSNSNSSCKSKNDSLSHIDKNPLIETESTNVTSSVHREKTSDSNNNNSNASTTKKKKNEKYRSFENWIWAYKVFMKNNHGRHPSGVIKINNELYNIGTWKTNI